VTSGSNNLSTVSVRISRLLGSHFSKTGDVALVMFTLERKENREKERSEFLKG